jgi:hypothetical protein
MPYMSHPIWKTIQIAIKVFFPVSAQKFTCHDYSVPWFKHIQEISSNKYEDYIITIEIKHLSIDFPLSEIDLDIEKEWFEHIHIQCSSRK